MELAVAWVIIQIDNQAVHVVVVLAITQTMPRIAVVVLILVLKIVNKIWILKKDRISKNCV